MFIQKAAHKCLQQFYLQSSKNWKKLRCPSVNKCLNKAVVYLYNGIIFSNKKVYHKSVILNESQTQDQILYGYVYMKFTGKRNPKRQKAVNNFLGLEGEQKLNANEHSTFEVAINALKARQ